MADASGLTDASVDLDIYYHLLLYGIDIVVRPRLCNNILYASFGCHADGNMCVVYADCLSISVCLTFAARPILRHAFGAFLRYHT